MRKTLTVSLLQLAICSALLAQMRNSPPPSPPPKLIKAGRLLDVRSGKYLLNQAILTEGEKIKEIGPITDVQSHAPADAVVIDLSQATLLPGLIDCHAHLLMAGDLGRLDPAELLSTTLVGVSPSQRALLGARLAKEVLEAGITSARVVGHSGVDGDVALRDAINAGWVPGPRLQVAGRKIATIGAQGASLRTAVAREAIAQDFILVSGPEQARAAVRENIGNGADLIKIVIDTGGERNWKTRYMPVEDARAVVEDAHRLGVKVTAHASDNVAVKIAIDAGVDSIDHAWSATDELLMQMKAKGIFLVATEIFVAAPPKDRLQRAMKIGVKIAMGSDAWATISGKTRGEATLLDLKKLQDEGMSNIDIIRSSTINAAELMGWSDKVGELMPGRFADIVAVSGDPVQDIGLLQHVQFVMKGATVVRDDLIGSLR